MAVSGLSKERRVSHTRLKIKKMCSELEVEGSSEAGGFHLGWPKTLTNQIRLSRDYSADLTTFLLTGALLKKMKRSSNRCHAKIMIKEF